MGSQPDLVTWWAWHDGAPLHLLEPNCSLVSLYWPLPFELAITRWREHVEEWEPELGICPPTGFPFVSWDGAAALCVDPVDGSVGRIDFHEGSYRVRWSSLTSFVTQLTALWEVGNIRLTENGPDFDDDRENWPPGVNVHW